MSERCPDITELLAHAEGRTEAPGATDIENHLTRCPECRSVAESLRDQVASLRAAGGAPGVPRLSVATCSEQEEGRGYDAGAYLNGELDDAERAKYERHVAGCAACLAELSDLISARSEDAPRVAEAVVKAALTRLRGDRNRVVVELTRGALRFVEGWMDAARDFAAATGFDSRVPALAGVRSGAPPVTLHWEAGPGYVFDCEMTPSRAGAEIVGRVLRGSDPAVDVSVAVRGQGAPRGPESVDAEGRFGPWTLATGASELRFEALNLPEGVLSVTLEVAPEERVSDRNA